MSEANQISEQKCKFCGETIYSNHLRDHLPCSGVGQPESDITAGERAGVGR